MRDEITSAGEASVTVGIVELARWAVEIRQTRAQIRRVRQFAMVVAGVQLLVLVAAVVEWIR
jgi:hypothetical protein